MEKWTGLRKAWLVTFSLACIGLMSIGAIGVFQGDETRVIRVSILCTSAIAWLTSMIIARRINRSQTDDRSERA
jgi:hypothetical protein